MPESTIEVRGIVKRYVTELRSRGVHIERAVLFGSQAHGTPTEYSDIDVALVSEDFEGLPLNDTDKIRPAKFAVDWRIDPLTYRPEDFDESDLFVKEILATGIEIPCGE